MNCPNCGSQLRPGAKFCGKCGKKSVGQAQPAAQPKAGQPASVRPTIPKFPTGYWAWLGWGVACLFLVTTVIFGFRTPKSKGAPASAKPALTQPQPGTGGQPPPAAPGVQSAPVAQTSSRPEVNDFTLPYASDTGSFKLATLRGKVVALSFWSYIAIDCDKQVAQLAALQKKYGKQDFTVVGVGMDNPADLKSAAASFKINYPVVAGSRAVMKSFDIDKPPAVVFLDRRMGKAQLFAGFKPEDGQQMDDLVKVLIAEPQ